MLDCDVPSVVVSLKLSVCEVVSFEDEVSLSLSETLLLVPCCLPALTPTFTPAVAVDMVESLSV